MYLQKVVLKNFRSFADTTIHFAKDLTVLAGANNAGKSNVLDSLRLVLSTNDSRQRLYPDEDDLRIKDAPFTIETIFDELTDDQKGLFVTAIGDIIEGKAQYGYRYSKPDKNVRLHRPEHWAGSREGAEPEPAARQLIRHVYLPALRDAQRELASSRSDRISFLLRHFADDKGEDIDDLEKIALESIAPVNKHPLIQRASNKISDDLSSITQGVQKHGAQLGFAPPSLRSLARDLRLHLLQQDVNPVDLSNCGLGYANLLYIACVLVELEAAADADLTVFLVEEPEAHLHPQLQAVLLTYLRDKARKSHETKKAIGVPEGRIQVIVATHSPNLAASVPIEDIVVLRRRTQSSSSSFSVPTSIGQKATPVTTRSASIPVARLGLAEQHRRKITRYLDVTKSSLLFSSRILLVEGISEALLLPVIAKRMFGEAEKEALDRFHGSTLVPIEGVDFVPYVTLLLTAIEGQRIADLVVVLTDTDDSGSRVALLQKLGSDLNASGLLEVIPVPTTLEAAIYDCGNSQILQEVFCDLRPSEKLKQAFLDDVKSKSKSEQGKAYADLLREKRVRKGDHAQLLAARIEEGASFEVPECLEAAIRKIACAEKQT